LNSSAPLEDVVAVDSSRTAWTRAAEEALRRVRGIEEATIRLEDDEIREIHILTTSTRPAKQIVRDVQGILHNKFQRTIDYRIVSVVYLDPPAAATPAPVSEAEPVEAPAPAAPAPAPAASTAPPVSPPAARTRPATEWTEAAPAASATAPPGAGGDRIRFVGVNLFVSGARTQAQVELRWRGFPRMGSASGWSTRGGAHRLIAQATLAAVQEFLADELALAIEEVRVVRQGRKRVVLVSIALVTHRDERTLIGTCVIQQDLQRSVVLATLSALNRLVGGLRVKQPTEYVLRPAST
jgi:hypothetical protein